MRALFVSLGVGIAILGSAEPARAQCFSPFSSFSCFSPFSPFSPLCPLTPFSCYPACPWYCPPLYCPAPLVDACAAADPTPANLDVKKLKPAKKIPEKAVGGGAVGEGYLTTYGAFRLGGGSHEALIMAQNPSNPRGFFNQAKLTYIREYKDAPTGIAGSLYRTTVDDKSERYYFFANQDAPDSAPVRKRAVIAYDGSGRVLHMVLANYAPMLK